MSNRTKSDVMGDILRVKANDDGRRLRIMYCAYVSYGQLEERADFMFKRGLVYKEEGSELHKLTLKGEGFLVSSEHIEANFAVEP